MTTAEHRWRRSSELAFVESPGRVAILDLTHLDRPPVILEDSAATIWGHLHEPITADALSAAVAEEYDVALVEVAPAVADFLSQLGELGLVEPE